jgi:SAM-dependent methyltransferase
MEFDVYRCDSCGLVGLPAVETDERYYQQFYPQGYHTPTAPGFAGQLWGLFASFLLRRKVDAFKPYVSLPCKLLDVGCGNGSFLKVLDVHQFDAHGLEPVQEAVEDAKKAGLQVSQGNIQSAALAPEQFDVITLWHVFEHIRDPGVALQRIHALLRPGGIVVMALPNTHSLACRLGNQYWFHLDSPRHLWLYNKANIQRVLEANHFQLLKHRYLRLEYPLDLLWSIQNSWLGKALILLYPLIKCFDTQNMMVIARKR